MSIAIAPSALEKISEIVAADGAGRFFRVGVEGGGCQGFSYVMGLDDKLAGDDVLVEKAGDNPLVVVDGVSSVLLDGVQIDWTVSLTEEKFSISNPNARSSCGCGESFSM
jgi:iron-sulfur cluster insertion protein